MMLKFLDNKIAESFWNFTTSICCDNFANSNTWTVQFKQLCSTITSSECQQQQQQQPLWPRTKLQLSIVSTATSEPLFRHNWIRRGKEKIIIHPIIALSCALASIFYNFFQFFQFFLIRLHTPIGTIILCQSKNKTTTAQCTNNFLGS